MYWTVLREWIEAKGVWISLLVGLVGIVLTVNVSEGPVWISAAIALCFAMVFPPVNTWRRWHLYSRREKIWNVCSDTFFTVYLGFVIVHGLVAPTKDAMNVPSAFGLVGIDVILALLFILLAQHIPAWGRSRKKCPDCFEHTNVAARACPHCGYRWPEKPGHLALD